MHIIICKNQIRHGQPYFYSINVESILLNMLGFSLLDKTGGYIHLSVITRNSFEGEENYISLPNSAIELRRENHTMKLTEEIHVANKN